MREKTALVLVAKEPDPARSKTRLSSALSARGRQQLAEAMLLDKRDQLASIDGVERVLAFDPPEARGRLSVAFGDGWRLESQGEGSLGARLWRVCSSLTSSGFSAVILVGSDSPTLSPSRLCEARDALSSGTAHDAVLGPADDGGYYLLGLRRFDPRVFEGIDWSTERVFAQTVAALERVGIRWSELARGYDVDVGEDLARLEREMSEDERARALAPRTYQWIVERSAMRLAETSSGPDNRER